MTCRRFVPACLVWVLLFAPSSPALGQQPLAASRDSTYQAGYSDGRQAAGRVGTFGYFAGGFASGLFLPIMGPTTMVVVSLVAEPMPPTALSEQASMRGEAYRTGFENGYAERGRSRHFVAALTGALLGTAAFVTTVVVLAK